MEIKFKPFAGKKERNLKGLMSVITLTENYFKSEDKYSLDRDDEVECEKHVHVDCTITYPKDKITTVQYYWSNDDEGYMLQVNDLSYGFADREAGMEVFSTVTNWLYANQ